MKFYPSFKLAFVTITAGLLAFAMSGCGGGGGSEPVNYAPLTISGKSMTFRDPDFSSVTTTYTFTSSSYTSEADSGTYTYARTSTLHHATLTLSSSFSAALHYQLTFTSAAGGTYLDTDTAKTSSFTLQ